MVELIFVTFMLILCIIVAIIMKRFDNNETTHAYEILALHNTLRNIRLSARSVDLTDTTSVKNSLNVIHKLAEDALPEWQQQNGEYKLWH